MWGIRSGLISIIGIGLLVLPIAGVTAQEGTGDKATAAEFTGATSFGPCSADYCVNPIVEPFTDERLAGEFRVSTSSAAYPGGPTFWAGGFSMLDEDGAWVQRPGLTITHTGGASATQVIIMDGAAAYEGLTIVPKSSGLAIDGTGVATSSTTSCRPHRPSRYPSRYPPRLRSHSRRTEVRLARDGPLHVCGRRQPDHHSIAARPGPALSTTSLIHTGITCVAQHGHRTGL